MNVNGGLLGRELRLQVVDGGAAPGQVADAVEGLMRAGHIQAVTGWHTSAVREALVPRLRGRLPYVYTPLYEGGEHSPGVFLTGETPERQLGEAMRWLSNELGIQRWCIVGDDYVWPRGSAPTARQFGRQHRAEICDEIYVPLGCTDFADVAERVKRSSADGVLMLLVGEDGVHFNRVFADAGLDEAAVRFSPLMDENMLLASGAEGTRRLYSAAGFFESLASASALDFVGRYSDTFGFSAPVPNSLGESCYEGIKLLAALVEHARSLDVAALMRIADRTGYDGPRGRVYLQDRHLVQTIYLARADGLEFDVLTSL